MEKYSDMLRSLANQLDEDYDENFQMVCETLLEVVISEMTISEVFNWFVMRAMENNIGEIKDD